jgi:YafQ family addiction module toxin component
LNIEYSNKFIKILEKLDGKDHVLALAVKKKIKQVVNSDIKHYKNLKGDMCDLRRVHVGHFVILFQVENDTVIFEDFCHHDEVY